MDWAIVNKILKKYLKNYKSNQKGLQDKLEEVLNSSEFGELNNIGNGDKLRRLLLKTNFPKDSYFDYLKNYYMTKARITNKDVLYMTLIVYYWQFAGDLKTETMFNDIIDHSIQTALKTLPKGHKRVDSDFIKLYIMTIPNHLGWNWLDFREQEIIYNVREFIRELNIKKKNLDNLMLKQQKRHLNINVDKYSGSVESHVQFLVNQAILEVGKQAGMEKCKFIGINDKVQTKMCHSMNNQIFYLNKENVFKRYSANAEAIINYRVRGMVLGINLPPLIDHFHYCRSTITYQVD